MLKKLLMVSSLSLLLIACGNDSATEGDATEEVSETVTENEETTASEEQDESDLNTVGDITTDNDGIEIELINISNPSEPYNIAEGVNIIFDSVKILQYHTIPDAETEYMDSFGISEGDYALEIIYSIENSNDYMITDIDEGTVTTSTGEQLNNDYLYAIGFYNVKANDDAYETGFSMPIDDPEVESVTIDWTLLSMAEDSSGEIQSETVTVEFQ